MNVKTQPGPFLINHTFVALTDDTLGFLDLRRDKYSWLERRRTMPVRRSLGLPAYRDFEGNVGFAYEDNRHVAQIIQDMMDNEFATRHRRE